MLCHRSLLGIGVCLFPGAFSPDPAMCNAKQDFGRIVNRPWGKVAGRRQVAGGKPGRLSAARSIIWARPANPTGLSAPRWGLGQVSSVQLCRFMRRALIGLPAAFLPPPARLAPQGKRTRSHGTCVGLGPRPPPKKATSKPAAPCAASPLSLSQRTPRCALWWPGKSPCAGQRAAPASSALLEKCSVFGCAK